MSEISPRVNSQKNDDSPPWEPVSAEPAQPPTDAQAIEALMADGRGARRTER